MHNIKHMISVIQIYIHHKKGVEVNITPNLPRDLIKLISAYNIAQKWLDNNLV